MKEKKNGIKFKLYFEELSAWKNGKKTRNGKPVLEGRVRRRRSRDTVSHTYVRIRELSKMGYHNIVQYLRNKL